MARISIDPASNNSGYAEALTEPKIDYIVEYDRAEPARLISMGL
jgi:hypothetical protein